MDNQSQPLYRRVWNSLINPDSIELEEVLDAGEDAQHLDNFLLKGLFEILTIISSFYFKWVFSSSLFFLFSRMFSCSRLETSTPPTRIENYYFLIKSKKIFSTEWKKLIQNVVLEHREYLLQQTRVHGRRSPNWAWPACSAWSRGAYSNPGVCFKVQLLYPHT